MLVLNWNDVANRHVRIELFARRRQRNPDEPSQPGMIGLILCYIPIHIFFGSPAHCLWNPIFFVLTTLKNCPLLLPKSKPDFFLTHFLHSKTQ
jgi:hypothetical protein